MHRRRWEALLGRDRRPLEQADRNEGGSRYPLDMELQEGLLTSIQVLLYSPSMPSRTRKPLPDQPPSEQMREFWREAFLAAEFPSVVRYGRRVSPLGLAHMSAEYADAALIEFRRRFPRS